MKLHLQHVLLMFLFSSCSQTRYTTDKPETNEVTISERFEPGEKVYYRLSPETRVRGTIIKKISDSQYLVTIHQNSKGVRRKVSVEKIEKVD